MIPYGRQSIDDCDIEAVVATLRSDFLTQGPAVPSFENAVAKLCDVEHAIAVNSATSALHIACLALEIGPGDYVWTSPNTFVASANCARYCGANVDFVDIDPRTYNMCTDALEKKLEEAARDGLLPKVVIPVHFAGVPCEMEKIHELSTRYGFRIIEDASHAIGAHYRATRVGSCRYSDVTVFSFHPVKIITTAEGGLATTKSPELALRMSLLRSHGITRDPGLLENKDVGPWYYEQQCLGFNYRLTDLQAALGVSQLHRLDSWIERRHEIARTYDQSLRDLPVVLPSYEIDGRSALHLYVVQLDPRRTTVDRRTAFSQLRARGIGVNVHYIPVHTQPDYRKLGFEHGNFPRSEDYYAHCLSLPMYSGLTEQDQHFVILALRELLSS